MKATTEMRKLLGSVLPAMLSVILFGLTIFVLILPSIQQIMLNQKRQTCREMVGLVLNILDSYQAQVVNRSLSLEQAQVRAASRIRAMRYGPDKRGYFFIQGVEPVMIMHPLHPDREKQDLSKIIEPSGEIIFNRIQAVIKSSSKGFVHYNYFSAHDPKVRLAKITYAELYAPWQWVVCTGIYLEEVEQELADITRKLTWLGVGVFILVMLLSAYLARRSLRSETQSREAQQALAQNERKYHTLFESSNAAIFLLADGVVQDCNRKALEMLESPREEILGANPLDFSHPLQANGRSARYEGMRRMAAARKGSSQLFEWRFSTKSGGVVDTEMNLTALELDGRHHLLAICVDISERKKAEQERSRLERQLLQSQKMEAVGTLAGGIAHDFNNILTSVIGFSELALAKMERGGQPVTEMKNVLESGLNARDLIRQLLAFSRTQEGSPRVMDLIPVARETIKMVGEVAQPMVRIETHWRAPRMVVQADPVQVQQILLNLVTNALQALGEKSGIIQVSVDKVDYTSEPLPHPNLGPGVYCQLTVSDNGPGMSSQVLSRIFDPFFTTKAVGQGSGLGLSVVHGLVGKMGGAVLAQSQPGQGATFTVLIPLVDKDPTPASPEPEPEAMASGSGRILLVDDEEMVLNLLSSLLTETGFEVQSFLSPLGALEAFKAQPEFFDLVVTDLAMPEMSGMELAATLKKLRPNLPVILCTGYKRNLSREEANHFGIDHILRKPFNHRQLLNAVMDCLRETCPQD